MQESPNILLVDDNPKYLKDALPFYGYNVDTAVNGLEAITLLDKNPKKYDMVLLDVMMPEMDGWETLKKIRKNEDTKYVPVIMITAVSEEQKIISGLKIGADDYIVKPFILPNLLARIEAVLRRSNWQKAPDNADKPIVSNETTPRLTAREKEILFLVSQGESNQQIAKKMVLTEATIKSHLCNVFKKLNVKNRTQAGRIALEKQLIK